jgi:hypothetical protein
MDSHSTFSLSSSWLNKLKILNYLVPWRYVHPQCVYMFTFFRLVMIKKPEACVEAKHRHWPSGPPATTKHLLAEPARLRNMGQLRLSRRVARSFCGWLHHQGTRSRTNQLLISKIFYENITHDDFKNNLVAIFIFIWTIVNVKSLICFLTCGVLQKKKYVMDINQPSKITRLNPQTKILAFLLFYHIIQSKTAVIQYSVSPLALSWFGLMQGQESTDGTA